MTGNRKNRSHLRFLRIVFMFSLSALVLAVAALFVVQHTMSRFMRPIEPHPPVSTSYATDSEVLAPTKTQKTQQITLESAPIIEEEAVAENQTRIEDGVSAGTVMPADLSATRVAAGLTDEVIARIRADNASRYYYARLSEHEQILYAELYHIMTTFAEDVGISAMDTVELEKVQNCVMNDHPEIFYINGYYSTRYTLGAETVGFSFSGRYLYTPDVIATRQAAIDNYVTQCLANVPQGDDYAKIKYVYEYIISHTVYDINAPDNQNICSVMLYNASVCQGYAKSAQYLLNRLGIECTLVVGTVVSEFTSGSHAWNLVKSNGNWYYLDVTWGDASFTDGLAPADNIGYDYLLATGADIFKTHTVGSVVPMPVCDSLNDNYYVREGAYFVSADMNQFASLVQRRYAQGAQTVTFKCANADVYNQMMAHLIDQSAIFDYIRKAPGESLAFSRSDNLFSFTVWF